MLVEWYGRQDVALSDRVLDGVEATLAILARTPQRYRVRKDSLRMVALRMFPIQLWYEWHADSGYVLVTCVLHSASDQRLWLRGS